SDHNPEGLPHRMSMSPTLTAATQFGVILGTAAYMSPEQARGRAVDRRTDVWAFGCVLYEMLTGKPALRGADVTDIVASVVKGEPDWRGLPADLPRGIRTLIARCLQKDLRKRIRSAGDIAIDIEEALAPSVPVDSPPNTPATRQRTPWIVAAGAALV